MPYGNAVRRNFLGMCRKCPRCNQKMIVTQVMIDHGSYWCKPCKSKASVKWAKENRDKKRKSNSAYSARNSSNRAAQTAKYRKNNPEKRLAHQAVQTAIRNGTIQKQCCEVCDDVKAHAHHDDYSKPLHVRWLCHTHHMEHHMLKAREQ